MQPRTPARSSRAAQALVEQALRRSPVVAVALQMHPRIGASWEGFVLEKVIAESSSDEVYFWATHNGAELDLLLLRGGRRVGVEIKRVDAPRRTRSMAVAVDDLRLDALYVVYPGEASYAVGERITAVPAAAPLPVDDAGGPAF